METSGRWISGSAVLVLVSGCSTAQYYDTNAQVDARPECAGVHGRDESVAPWCEREAGVSYTIGGDSEPLDLTADDESL